jgi:hypothetical protein
LCVSFVIYLSVSWYWPKAEHPLFEREIKKGRRLQPVGARSDFVTRASTAIFARLDRHRNMLAGEHRLPVLNFIDHDIVDGIGQRRNAGIIECAHPPRAAAAGCAHRPPADRHASETTTGPRFLEVLRPFNPTQRPLGERVAGALLPTKPERPCGCRQRALRPERTRSARGTGMPTLLTRWSEAGALRRLGSALGNTPQMGVSRLKFRSGIAAGGRHRHPGCHW